MPDFGAIVGAEGALVDRQHRLAEPGPAPLDPLLGTAKVTTLITTADDCPNKWDCPSVHDLDVDPERRYVVSKLATAAEHAVFRDLLEAGDIVGWLPAGFLDERNALFDRARHVTGEVLDPARRYVITSAVRDPRVLAHFGDLVSRNEQLGTVPVRDLAVIA